jgi:Holliday junction resolvasome RuvABC endonuclease subunit
VSYAPQTVRKGLVGNGWATKREVAAAISSRYPALRIYLTQDRRWKERYWLNMFDAIALALYHASQPPSRSRSCG